VIQVLRVAIVEDQQEDANRIKAYLERYCDSSGLAWSAQIFDNPLLFLKNFHADFDLIFMDVEMPHMDGISVSHKIREMDEGVPIIVVTNMKQMALKGYEFNAFNFIIKPVNYYGLELTLKRAVRHIARKAQHYLTIPIKFGERRLDVNDVRYVEMLSRKLIYHVNDEEVISMGTLKDVEVALHPFGFRRCNNCFLVNLRYITKIYKDSIFLGDEELIISRPRKKAFLQELTDYWGGTD